MTSCTVSTTVLELLWDYDHDEKKGHFDRSRDRGRKPDIVRTICTAVEVRSVHAAPASTHYATGLRYVPEERTVRYCTILPYRITGTGSLVFTYSTTVGRYRSRTLHYYALWYRTVL